MAFIIAMRQTQFTPEEKKIVYCQLFVEHLAGAALTWFSQLDANSIDNFHQLYAAFWKHYSMFISKGASSVDLWVLSQRPNESL